jgi:glycine/D-amino acid oxidase-like deaminating enzyme
MVKNLYKGNLYWDKTTSDSHEFDKINTDLNTSVLIVGGGFSGNLCAHILSKAGMDVTVVDKNKVGRGSSVASTGLIQYRSDKMLSEFIDEIGEEKAQLFYQMCLEAVDQLSKINEELDTDTEYRLKDSIYYASSKKDEKLIKTEYRKLAEV